MKNLTVFTATLLSSLTGFAQEATPLPQLGKSPIKEVIKAMTLDEKIKFVVGTGMRMGEVAPPPKPAAGTPSPIGTNLPAAGTPPPLTAGTPPAGAGAPPAGAGAPPLTGMPAGIEFMPTVGSTETKVAGAAGTLSEIPRLGIPAMVVADGPAGLRISPKRKNDSTHTFYCTAFPVATLLASSWDTALVQKVGAAIGNEVHEYGVDILLAPGMNIHRNPLGGRNFEYYSEDPLVTGKITAAMVNGVQSNGVGVSIKHFAANNQETERSTINTLVTERTMREIYLQGFKIAVQSSNPWTVMSSYNKINGTMASESVDLLTNILRKDWGFQGFVMTDWFGGKNPVEQMKAGNDLLMPGTPSQLKKLAEAVASGQLSMDVLDNNVEHILNILLKTPTFQKYAFSNQPDLKSHAQIARAAASEGMVLLKNEQKTLPFSPKLQKIALFGNTSYNMITGGTGSGDVNEAYTVSMVQGFSNANLLIDNTLKDLYEPYIDKATKAFPKKKMFFEPDPVIPEYELDLSKIVIAAEANEVAVLTIGRNSGEFLDRKLEADYYLTATEKDLIKNVSEIFHAKGKKVVVLLNIGGVIETNSWSMYPDAILLAWQAGQESGNSIADVLTGKVNPSGKLATTFPKDYGHVPSANNFPGTPKEKPTEVIYKEGIYVGYRYYESFAVPVAYEFGYGQSYTTFNFKNLKLSDKKFGNQLTVTVDVTNTGTVAGKEVVQLYLTAPSKNLVKPAQELRGFAKTSLLQPNQTQTITLVLDAKSLTSFDEKQSAWIAEAGKYGIKIGSSSQKIQQTGTFSLEKERMVEKESKSLVPTAPIMELRK